MTPGREDALVAAKRPTRAAVLVVRAWVDESAEDRLLVRLIGTLDVERLDEVVDRVVAGRDEAVEAVAAWLTAFARGSSSSAP